MLHSQIPVQFEKYQEGELSILENELSKMTLKLSEQAAALADDKKFLADSMADISHQIRSPLTSSNLILSLLMEPDLPSVKRKKLLQELAQLLSRIDWLVESLLKMSKMDAGTVCFQQAPVNVRALIRQSAEPLMIPMELREQTFSIQEESGGIYRRSGLVSGSNFKYPEKLHGAYAPGRLYPGIFLTERHLHGNCH